MVKIHGNFFFRWYGQVGCMAVERLGKIHGVMVEGLRRDKP